MPYFINPRTGRKCKVGGPTHRKLMRQGGRGLPSLVTGLLLKEVGLPLAKKLGKLAIPLAKKGFKIVKKGKKKYFGRGHYPRGKGYKSKNRMMMAGTGMRGYGLTVAGGALKLAGQGKKKRYHPQKFVFR